MLYNAIIDPPSVNATKLPDSNFTLVCSYFGGKSEVILKRNKIMGCMWDLGPTLHQLNEICCHIYFILFLMAVRRII